MRFKILLIFCLAPIFFNCGKVDVGNLDSAAFDPATVSPNTCAGVSAAFVADVTPLFASKGCDASGCHNSASKKGGLSLDVPVDGAPTVLVAVKANSRINTTTPRSSQLLRKSIGLDGHVQSISSIFNANYTTLFCWIAAGAQDN